MKALLLGFLLLVPAALRAGGGPSFSDEAAPAGLAAVSAQNPVWADLNGDGWPDAVLGSTHGGKTTYVFLSTPAAGGGRAFYDFTAESGLNAAPAPSTAPRAGSALAFGDADNDGDLDVFSARYSEFEKPKASPAGEIVRSADGNPVYEAADDGLRSALLLNDGGGRFAHLERAGVENPPETTTSAAFLDYNNDGVLDLYAGNWYREYGVSFLCYPSRLYKGLGNGMLEETTAAAGLLTTATEGRPDSSRPVYGVSHCDWDNDGLQDLLVPAYGRQANRLWRNNGDGTFRDAGPESGFDGDALRHGRYPEGVKRKPEPEWRSHGNTFSAACADYDNDGDLDVFLSEITHAWAGEASDRSSVLENLGKKKGFAFRRRPELLYRVHQDTRNWNQGDMRASWADFDNDGLLDLLLASGDYPDGQYLRLFRQVKTRKFKDITAEAGLDWESSGGVSVADYDRDGDLDILAGKSWMRLPAHRRKGPLPAPALLRNELANGNHWLAIKLEGRGAGATNRGGVGVRVTVKAGRLLQTRAIHTSRGHAGLADEQLLHFGLGKAGRADSVEVRWITGSAVYKDVAADRYLKITEGAGLAEWTPAR